MADAGDGRAVPGWLWWVWVALLSVGWLVTAGVVGNASADFYDNLPATRAVTSFHPERAYPDKAGTTSPPGYPLVAAPAVAVLQPFLGSERAFAWVGMATPLVLAAAAVRLGRALGVAPWSLRELVTAAAVLVAPGVPHAVLATVGTNTGIFHPQDVVAAAEAMMAVAAAVRGRWTWCAVWLGIALLTRQWALLVALPLVVAAPEAARVRVVCVAGGLFLAGLLPFLLGDPDGAIRALRAGNSLRNGQSLVGHLPLTPRLVFAFSRGAPVIGAMVLAVVLAWRWQRVVPLAAGVLGAVVAGVAFRTGFDAAFFAYYLGPLSAFVVVAVMTRLVPVVAGVVWLVLLLVVTSTAPVGGPFPGLVVAWCVFLGSVTAAAWGLWLAWTRVTPARSSGSLPSGH